MHGVDASWSVLVALFGPEGTERCGDGGSPHHTSGRARLFRVEFEDREKSRGARLAEFSKDAGDFGVAELIDDVAAGRESSKAT